MHCNGLMIPGSENYRFYIHQISKMPTPDPILRVKLPTRIHVRSFKTKANINNGAATVANGFYVLLGVPGSVTLPEIKRAYKQLARKYHPDVSPPDRVEEYTQRFIRVQEAYETLSDPERRAMYDRNMAQGLHLPSWRSYHCQNHMKMEARNEWKKRWQSQLSTLERRSASKVASGNMPWAARMRRQREEGDGVLF